LERADETLGVAIEDVAGEKIRVGSASTTVYILEGESTRLPWNRAIGCGSRSDGWPETERVELSLASKGQFLFGSPLPPNAVVWLLLRRASRMPGVRRASSGRDARSHSAVSLFPFAHQASAARHTEQPVQRNAPPKMEGGGWADRR